MSAPATPALARPVLGLAARSALLMAALLPGIALLAVRGDAALWPRFAIALLAALCFEAIALRLRRQPVRPFLIEGSALFQASLLVLWLPALDGWQLAGAVFVALVLARQAFGGLGANLFHPAMAGAAAAQGLWSVPVAANAPDVLLAAAWLLGGALVIALRISRWPSALGLLAGALALLLLRGEPLQSLADPRWALAACFIAGDTVCAGEQSRTRLLSGLGAGALAAAAGSRALAALPFAILAMNVLVPWLDAGHAPRRAAGASP